MNAPGLEKNSDAAVTSRPGKSKRDERGGPCAKRVRSEYSCRSIDDEDKSTTHRKTDQKPKQLKHTSFKLNENPFMNESNFESDPSSINRHFFPNFASYDNTTPNATSTASFIEDSQNRFRSWLSFFIANSNFEQNKSIYNGLLGIKQAQASVNSAEPDYSRLQTGGARVSPIDPASSPEPNNMHLLNESLLMGALARQTQTLSNNYMISRFTNPDPILNATGHDLQPISSSASSSNQLTSPPEVSLPLEYQNLSQSLNRILPFSLFMPINS